MIHSYIQADLGIYMYIFINQKTTTYMIVLYVFQQPYGMDKVLNVTLTEM